MRQLLLNVLLRDDANFENFYAGSNQPILDYLKNPQENLIYLYAKPHAGLTHVLQALCKTSLSCLYVPLEKTAELSPEILDNLSNLDLIIIDDIENIAGQSDWENKIFNLYNLVSENKKRLMIAGHTLPQLLNIKLLDLKSRLQAMLLLTLESLSDDEKITAMQLRAHNRGLNLPDEVAQFLLNHSSRDMAKLFEVLVHLDRHSLEENRRLTIPFVKKVLYTD
jgi:DnaA family protein